MRLKEVANHTWDVRVAFYPHVGVDADSAAVLVDLLTGPLGFMLSWLAKPPNSRPRVSITVPGVGLVIDDAPTVLEYRRGHHRPRGRPHGRSPGGPGSTTGTRARDRLGVRRLLRAQLPSPTCWYSPITARYRRQLCGTRGRGVDELEPVAPAEQVELLAVD